MLSPLAHRTYRHLFLAQVLSLLGTGLATVALGLLAYEVAGADAGAVLGTALTLKMVAYVGLAPVAGAFVGLVPRRALLVALDLLRAGIALLLPFVTEVWQVYVLVFVLQAGSAAFTPTFQATIPDVLPDEAEYTRALSLSRLAYDLEALASPAIAAGLLGLVGFHWLFAGNALGFLASAALVLSVQLPSPKPPEAAEGAWARITRGSRIYLATPRLRGLLALNLTVAGAGAMVIVNTVVLVRGEFGLGQSEVAWTLAAYGFGSMLAALALPRLLDRAASDRTAMLVGAALLVAGLLLGTTVPSWPVLLPLWALLGLGNGLVLTPAGRLLRRSAAAGDRPALFAAQFALSHACWLVAYPLAGHMGAAAGLDATFLALAALAGLGCAGAAVLWPRGDGAAVEHVHRDLPDEDAHIAEAESVPGGGFRHRHAMVFDARHPDWP
ncbi:MULTISPECIES: MFS transporter [Roseicella]|uniref:MFS transporter n=2 Tax=Roseicella TaxID=2730923 RepID=A0A9X1IGE7_9PROT|nr:MFS transporter [Roseicella frigidaeris]MCB4824194.1 MFS transporter [Roseicella aerolata]RAI56078.1 MFS transporter [Roseicella frigidaeris]